MKKKILVTTLVFCLTFLIGGVYISLSISAGTRHLDNVIRMHQVEILREQLLYRVKTVQSAIKAKNTRYFEGVDATIRDVWGMDQALQGCFDCHHGPVAQASLEALRDDVRAFERSISRMLTVRANAKRLATAEDQAWAVGDALVQQIDQMIAMTNDNLQRQTRSVLDRIRRGNRFLYALLALGPLLAIGLAFAVVRWLARPIEILLEATRRLKAGDLEHRVPPLQYEFGELSQAFNEMSGSLRKQMELLQHTEQLAVCGKLAAGLAHEIKNPLAGIKVSLQLLGEEIQFEPEDRDLLDRARNEIDRIDGLMRNLLDFARPAPPELGTVNLNLLVDEAVELATREMPRVSPERGLEVEKELSESLPPVNADAKRLRQVLLNLLLNAKEAMAEGGTLSVRTVAEGEEVVVTVCDTGPGIAPDSLEQIFEPFFTRKRKGTGLGLAISRRIVEQHDGSLVASNRASGGACFTVRIPRVPAHAQRAA